MFVKPKLLLNNISAVAIRYETSKYTKQLRHICNIENLKSNFTLSNQKVFQSVNDTLIVKEVSSGLDLMII